MVSVFVFELDLLFDQDGGKAGRRDLHFGSDFLFRFWKAA
jgi:hypothetical protein